MVDRSFTYLASATPFEADGRRFVKVFAIDPTPNANDWKVTPEALKNAAESLLGQPLIGPPEKGHEGDLIAGRFVAVQSNHVAYGIAEVTDEKAWEKIQAGDWRLVSPKIRGVNSHMEGKVEVVDEFFFDHVAFVDQPAYGPKASVRKLCEGSEEFCTFNLAFAASRQSNADNVTRGRSMEQKTAQAYPWEQCIQDMLDQGHSEESANKICAAIKNRTVRHAMELGLAKTEKEAVALIAQKLKDDPLYAYTLGRLVESGFFEDEQAHDASEGIGSSQPCPGAKPKVGSKNQEEKEKPMSEDVSKRLESLEAAFTALKASKESLDAEVKVVKGDNEKLRTYIAQLQAEKTKTQAEEVAQLRLKAGLCDEKTLQAEIDTLSKLSPETLTQMAKDLGVLSVRLEAAAGPKAKFSASENRSVVEQVRRGLFGYTRDEKGGIVHG